MLKANIAVVIVGLLHLVIACVEMFFWKAPAVYGRIERLGLNQGEAGKVAPIVANAGLYNAFIAAGLMWSVFVADGAQALSYFFLSCVAVAGIYGAVTLKWTTLVLQTLPALIAAFLVWSAGQAG